MTRPPGKFQGPECPCIIYYYDIMYLVAVTRQIPPLGRCRTWLCTVFQVPVRWFPSTSLCSASSIRCCPTDRSGWRPETTASEAAACPVWTAVDLDPRTRGRSRPCKRPPWPRTGLTRSSKSSWWRAACSVNNIRTKWVIINSLWTKKNSSNIIGRYLL